MKSLFIVASPLQCLCAFEAIQKFNIKEPVFEIVQGEENDRFGQLKKLLDTKQYYYYNQEPSRMVKDNRLLTLLYYYIYSFFLRNPIFEYVFVGDYINGLGALFTHHHQIKKGIIYLDDGDSSIQVLNGMYCPARKERFVRSYIDFLGWCHSFTTDTYFTLYHEINTSHFKIVKNDLTIVNNNATTEPIDCYIVGTNPDVYCSHYGISYGNLLMTFENILKTIDGVSDKIYIPHGRDTEDFFKCKCIENSVKYKCIDTCIEYYFYTNKIVPKIVIGFGSSALFNLKKMYPNAVVINYMIKGNNFENCKLMEDSAVYYTNVGVKLITNIDELKQMTQI